MSTEIPSADLIRPRPALPSADSIRVKRLTGEEFAGKLECDWWEAQTKDLGPHKYGCLMLTLPKELQTQIINWAATSIPDGHLGPGKRETNPHVTIKYGFRDSGPDTVDALRDLLTNRKPILLQLKGLSLFTSGYGKWINEDGDVLKVDVESDELRELNAEITRLFPCEDKYPEYKPHLTVAYLEPTLSGSYAGRIAPFVNMTVVCRETQWSGADGTLAALPFGAYIEMKAHREIEEWIAGNGMGEYVGYYNPTGNVMRFVSSAEDAQRTTDSYEAREWCRIAMNSYKRSHFTIGLAPQRKALSWLASGQGAELVPPPQQGGKVIKLRRNKELPKHPKVKESFFATCKRDELGHCTEGSGAKESTPQEIESQAVEKSRSVLARLKDAPKKLVQASVTKAKNLYNKMEAKYGKIWARCIVGVAIVTFPTPFTMGAVGATIGLAHLGTKLFGAKGMPEEIDMDKARELAKELIDALTKELGSVELDDHERAELEKITGQKFLKPSFIAVRKSLAWFGKSEGTCKQGERADLTGCTPASGEDSEKKPTAEKADESNVMTTEGLDEQLPIDEYGRRRGTKPLGKIKIRAYRVGKVEDRANRGAVFFSGDADSVKPYATLHPGEEVKEYVLDFENALLAGHQNDLCKLFFNKTYGDMLDQFNARLGKKGAHVANAAFDKKLADTARKRGYDAVIYISPAPPAKTEIVMLGKPKPVQSLKHPVLPPKT